MPFELKIWCESCNREKSEIFRVKNEFFYKTPKDLLPYLKKNKKKYSKQKIRNLREWEKVVEEKKKKTKKKMMYLPGWGSMNVEGEEKEKKILKSEIHMKLIKNYLKS